MLSTSKATIFVTGGTGFLGSHFVLEWLLRGLGPIHALVRPDPLSHGYVRLHDALKVAQVASGADEQPNLEGLFAIDGDITRPDCGVDGEQIDDLRRSKVSDFWHFASDLRYEPHNQTRLHDTNVNGALTAADLAAKIGAKRFIYVSTAYVCGRKGGEIDEILPAAGLVFSNSYEASKAMAEHRLVEVCRSNGLTLTIVRPSIVIGPQSTQRPEGSATGLLGILHSILWIGSSEVGRAGHLRVAACPDAELNFVPVDCVVRDMLTLADQGFGNQCIYHLTARTSITVEACWRVIGEESGLHTLILTQPGTFSPSVAERLIERRLAFFLSYVTVERRFARSLPGGASLDEATFRAYVRKGLDTLQRTRAQPIDQAKDRTWA